MTHEAFPALAYLDVDHPVVAWGVYRGVLVSAEVASPSQGGTQALSMMFAGMLLNRNRVRLRNELLMEAVRSKRHPNQVSRLAGMYFFTDGAAAESALSWGGHFVSDNLAEVMVQPAAPATRADADWITYAPRDALGNLDPSDLSWIDSYWSGTPRGDTPVWESLVNGRATVLGTTLRQRAYDLLATEFPAALDMLEVARVAAAVDADLGQAVALLHRSNEGKHRIDYFLDMAAADDPTVLERIANYAGPKNWRDFQPGKATFGVPDFRRFSTELDL